MNINACFLFLRFSIGKESADDILFEEIDWEELFEFGKRQALLGVLFEGIKRLPCGVKISSMVLAKWVHAAKLIEYKNEEINRTCIQLQKWLERNGKSGCILKGQGNALMYSNPLSRTPGDIDVWVNGDPVDTLRFIKEKFGILSFVYHHAEVPDYNGISIEMHFRPCYMNNPIYNYRMQQWLKSECRQFDNWVSFPMGDEKICVPECSFNVVFQMSHIVKHLLFEGIGLRQLLDYYYVLQSLQSQDIQSCRIELQKFGLLRVASGFMWVLHEVFGLTNEKMIVPADKILGKRIFDEIIKTGNFGYYDSRIVIGHGKIGKYYNIFRRMLRLGHIIPLEAFFIPYQLIYNYIWIRITNKRI